MFFRTASRGVVAAAAILFLTSVTPTAQEFRGTIIGTISDRTGGVLPGVTVNRHQHRNTGGTNHRHRRAGTISSLGSR